MAVIKAVNREIESGVQHVEPRTLITQPIHTSSDPKQQVKLLMLDSYSAGFCASPGLSSHAVSSSDCLDTHLMCQCTKV